MNIADYESIDPEYGMENYKYSLKGVFMNDQEKIYYVYALLDTRKKGEYSYGEYKFEYEPFYIGKGKKYGETWERHRDHLLPSRLEFEKDGNILKKSIIKKILKETKEEPKVIKISENLNEINAFVLEKELIKIIGRRDLGKGPLSNMTDGGDGPSGRVVTEEVKKKLSDSSKKYFKENGVSEEMRKKLSLAWSDDMKKKQSETRKKHLRINGHPMTGRHHTEETKQKLREINSWNTGENNAFFGKHHSEEFRKKMSEMNSGDKHVKAKEYIVTFPNGEKKEIKGLRKFCKEYNINRGCLVETLKTKRPLLKGNSPGYMLEIKK